MAHQHLHHPLRWQRLVRQATESNKRLGLSPSSHLKPDVPEHVLVGRMMGAAKRRWKSPERRSFPQFHEGMTTEEYVREYYDLNGLGSRIYPDSYITMIDRPAPVDSPDPHHQGEKP